MTDPSDVEVRETEEELISKAQVAVSQCNWLVGECAAKWTVRYAKGRTDADFGGLVGLSGDQIYQRRRVWETFGDVAGDYPSLKWSHFYVSLNWDDAPECLQWAEENQATVSEMKAWRRALRGEDLTVESEPILDSFAGDPAVSFVPDQPRPVKDPAPFDPDSVPERGESSGNGSRSGESGPDQAMVAGVAREERGGDYAPFRQGAVTPPPEGESSETAVATRPKKPSPEQVIKRLTSTLERCHQAVTPQVTEKFSELPEKVQTRFWKAVDELNSKLGELK